LNEEILSYFSIRVTKATLSNHHQSYAVEEFEFMKH